MVVRTKFPTFLLIATNQDEYFWPLLFGGLDKFQTFVLQLNALFNPILPTIDVNMKCFQYRIICMKDFLLNLKISQDTYCSCSTEEIYP